MLLFQWNIPVGKDSCLIKSNLNELSVLSADGVAKSSLKFDEAVDSVAYSGGKAVVLTKYSYSVVSENLEVLGQGEFQTKPIVYKSVLKEDLLAVMYTDFTVKLLEIQDNKLVDKDTWKFKVRIADID